MILKLNVLITISEAARTFSVWADKLDEFPWIDIYEGHGDSLSAAVDDLYDVLPSKMVIDDETCITPLDMNYTIKRPFKISHSNSVRIFKVN